MKMLKYGNTNTYFINGLLFDTDMPCMMPQLFRTIKQNDIPFNIMCLHHITILTISASSAS